MLTITVAGKSVNDAINIVKNNLSGNINEDVKILVGGPSQADAVKKFLEAQGFVDVVPEDDDGILYLIASRSKQTPAMPSTVPAAPRPPAKDAKEIPGTIGVMISCRNKEYNSSFMKKFLMSLLKTNTKPDVIGLLDSAVKISAYNSPLCVILKKLETAGVQILISESCADRLGITEAAGAGVVVDMSEILDEIFSYSKIISI